MNRSSTRLVLAGLFAASLVGATAAVESAQAMPVQPKLATGGSVTAVQYDASGYRADYRPHHRYYRYHRYAGRYRCGPHQLHTHLQRRACD